MEPRKREALGIDKLRGSDEKRKMKDHLGSVQYLTYDVLNIIFKHLNSSDLPRVSQVCRLWREAASSEKRTRLLRLKPICLIHDCAKLTSSANTDLECFKSAIINDYRIKPRLGLFITAHSNVERLQECHCRHVPPSYSAVKLGTYGVIMNEKEIETNDSWIISTFLPEIPNVKVKVLIFEDRLKTYYEKIKQCFRTAPGKQDEKTDNCLILLCDQRGYSLATEITGALKEWFPEKNHRYTVWGGVACDLVACNSEKGGERVCRKPAPCIGIAFAGSGIRTWSVVIDKFCSTKQLVENKLRTFRRHISLQKYSIGFMFACCMRGRHMFDENNVESYIFKTVFPEVPLVGCTGDGEFGSSVMANELEKKRNKRWYHQVSTVFLILTYG